VLAVLHILSKFRVAVTIRQQEAEPVGKEFMFNIALKFGAPAQILTPRFEFPKRSLKKQV
jgi:hypothetical protein